MNSLKRLTLNNMAHTKASIKSLQKKADMAHAKYMKSLEKCVNHRDCKCEIKHSGSKKLSAHSGKKGRRMSRLVHGAMKHYGAKPS